MYLACLSRLTVHRKVNYLYSFFFTYTVLMSEETGFCVHLHKAIESSLHNFLSHCSKSSWMFKGHWHTSYVWDVSWATVKVSLMGTHTELYKISLSLCIYIFVNSFICSFIVSPAACSDFTISRSYPFTEFDFFYTSFLVTYNHSKHRNKSIYNLLLNILMIAYVTKY